MTTTTNKGYTEPTVGGDVGSWGNELNADLVIIDNNLGGNLAVSMTNADITLNSTQAQNFSYTVTGTLTGNHQLIFPAVGGFYQIKNGTSGAFTVTAIISSGTGVSCPQGQTTMVWADATNVYPGMPAGIWINRQVFTSLTPATYTPTQGTTFVDVQVQGGGGAGGGAALTGAAQAAIGGGGAGGGYVRKRITSSFSGVTVTVGAGGTGATAGANAGGNGGNTTFGGLLTGGGGTGGTGAVAASVPQTSAGGGAGGSATGGDINIPGQKGVSGSSISSVVVATSAGGSSALGLGGPSVATSAVSIGSQGTGFGSGSSGAANAASQVGAAATSAGQGGICIVDEYQ